MVKVNGEDTAADGRMLLDYLREAGYVLRTRRRREKWRDSCRGRRGMNRCVLQWATSWRS